MVDAAGARPLAAIEGVAGLPSQFTTVVDIPEIEPPPSDEEEGDVIDEDV
jgi:hypothetical protein